jgi:hypothetical protein
MRRSIKFADVMLERGYNGIRAYGTPRWSAMRASNRSLSGVARRTLTDGYAQPKRAMAQSLHPTDN